MSREKKKSNGVLNPGNKKPPKKVTKERKVLEEALKDSKTWSRWVR